MILINLLDSDVLTIYTCDIVTMLGQALTSACDIRLGAGKQIYMSRIIRVLVKCVKL